MPSVIYKNYTFEDFRDVLIKTFVHQVKIDISFVFTGKIHLEISLGEENKQISEDSVAPHKNSWTPNEENGAQESWRNL